MIGSGIGGLTTAVILAKSGKKEFYLQLLKSFFLMIIRKISVGNHNKHELEIIILVLFLLN